MCKNMCCVGVCALVIEIDIVNSLPLNCEPFSRILENQLITKYESLCKIVINMNMLNLWFYDD